MILRSLNRIIFFIVCGWAVAELIFCATFLYQPNRYMQTNSTSNGNFLFVMCKHSCDGFYKYALIGRMITLALLLMGNVLVS